MLVKDLIWRIMNDHQLTEDLHLEDIGRFFLVPMKRPYTRRKQEEKETEPEMENPLKEEDGWGPEPSSARDVQEELASGVSVRRRTHVESGPIPGLKK